MRLWKVVAKEQLWLGDGTFEDTLDPNEEEEGGSLGIGCWSVNDLEFGGWDHWVHVGIGERIRWDHYLDKRRRRDGV